MVSNVGVTAAQVETGLARTAITDHNSNYVLIELPIGHDTLDVAARGFSKYRQHRITLDVNERNLRGLLGHLLAGGESKKR